MANREFLPDTDTVQIVFEGLTVQASIGSGGQKVVFDAHHPQYGRIALKLVKPGSNEDRMRSLREIEVSKNLSGDNFARIYDYGEIDIKSDNVLYIFEEFLEGKNLRQILTDNGKLNLNHCMIIAQALLEALVILHESNVIHRDIKPENIFSTLDKRIVLLDMGIARNLSLESLTADAAPFGPGTPGYAAPEQIMNRKRIISWRTDMFAFGIVLYECLTGHNPFTENTRHIGEALQNTLRLRPTPLNEIGFPKIISDIVSICMEKHTHKRYINAQMAIDLIKRSNM